MKVYYVAPTGFDYSSNQLQEGLHLMQQAVDGLQFRSARHVVHHGAKLNDLHQFGTSRALAEEADVIIHSSGGDWSFLEGEEGLLLADPVLSKKTVFLDGHDSNRYLIDPSEVAVYLKRELRYPEVYNLEWGNVRSMLFGIYDFHFDYLNGHIDYEREFDQREIDVSFVAFGGSNSERARVANLVEKLNGYKGLNTFAAISDGEQPVPMEEYRRIMRSSKVVMSFPGAGLDTLRFWETMGFGAVLCSVDIPRMLVMRNPPEPGRDFIAFQHMGDVPELLVNVVTDRQRWCAMRMAADNRAQLHSTTRRAQEFIDICHEIMSLS